MNKKDKIYLDRRVTVNGLQSHIHLDNFIDLIKWIQERIDDGDIVINSDKIVDFQYNTANDECTITLDDGTLFTTLIPSLKSVLDTPTLNLTATGSVLSGVVNISSAVNNVLASDSTGLYVPESVSPPITPVDTNSIDITVSGVNDHTLQIDVKVATDANNNVEIKPTGLFVDVKANETTTTVTNTVTGKTIGTYTNEDGSAVNINETITTLGNTQVVGKTIGIYTSENATVSDIKETITGLSNLIAGNRIATYTDENGTAVDINQYITSLSNLQANGKIIGTFTNEASTTFDIKETVTGTTQVATGAITYTNENGINSISNLRSADAGNVLTIGANNGLHYTPAVSNSYNNTTGVLSTTVNGVTGSNITLGTWLNVGNTGLVVDVTNLLGTNSLVDVDFVTNSTKRGRIYSTGNWYLGNSPSATGTSTVNIGGSFNLINTNGTNYSVAENGVIYYTGLGSKQTFLHTGGGSTNATAAAFQNLFLGLSSGNSAMTTHTSTISGNIVLGNNSLTNYTPATTLANTIIGNNINAVTNPFTGTSNVIITNSNTRWHNIFTSGLASNIFMLAGNATGTGTPLINPEPSVSGMSGSGNIIIGTPYTANTNSNIVSIGRWTRCAANGDVAIGNFTPVGTNSSFLLGSPVTSFRTITMTPTVKDVIWTNATIFGADSSLTLTDRAGDDLIIASGRGTGSGVPGTLRLTSPVTGTTGTTNHTFPAIPRLTIRPSTSVSTPGNIGINNDTPTSQLHVNGSIAVSIASISVATTLGENNHVIATLGPYLITLPAANTCTGRRYVIKCLNNAKTISSYLDVTNTASTILPLGITTIVSDGTNWQQF